MNRTGPKAPHVVGSHKRRRKGLGFRTFDSVDLLRPIDIAYFGL